MEEEQGDGEEEEEVGGGGSGRQGRQRGGWHRASFWRMKEPERGAGREEVEEE